MGRSSPKPTGTVTSPARNCGALAVNRRGLLLTSCTCINRDEKINKVIIGSLSHTVIYFQFHSQ
jgi:hypothetical protein